MSDSNNSQNELYESLRRQVDLKKIEEQITLAKNRETKHNSNVQKQLKELIENNSTLPVTISSIQVTGGKHTSVSFLERVLNPLVREKEKDQTTLSEALRVTGTVVDKLSRFGIYRPGIITFIDHSNELDQQSTPTPIDIYLNAHERGRLSLKTGTDLGNAEGSAYGNLEWRNIFGGAESLNLNASAGTRTRSSYQATYDSPLLGDPDKRLGLDVYASSTLKPWASHEEVRKGIGARYSWTSKSWAQHQVGYTGLWRQVTNLTKNASRTIRNEAGDSIKSSLSHTYISDHRDHPLLPTRGYLFKSISEIAGWGPLQGDVAFWKTEIEMANALSFQIPGLKNKNEICFSNGFRAGVHYPLPIGFGRKPGRSRITDRFFLGGPTDVRGFKTAGIGPRDGSDSIGGDVYAAASTNILMPLPRIGKDTPLRFQIFANAGRLLTLSGQTRNEMVGVSYRNEVLSTVAELTNGLPSLVAGFGLVYAHPAARFELNFCLPLVIRVGEETRKGLQFGVGINFL